MTDTNAAPPHAPDTTPATPASEADRATMRRRVEATIEVIRPALQADGGDVELIDVNADTGLVTVRLVGACGTCPVSTQTLKGGMERILRDRVDGVTEVIDISGDTLE